MNPFYTRIRSPIVPSSVRGEGEGASRWLAGGGCGRQDLLFAFRDPSFFIVHQHLFRSEFELLCNILIAHA